MLFSVYRYGITLLPVSVVLVGSIWVWNRIEENNDKLPHYELLKETRNSTFVFSKNSTGNLRNHQNNTRHVWMCLFPTVTDSKYGNVLTLLKYSMTFWNRLLPIGMHCCRTISICLTPEPPGIFCRSCSKPDLFRLLIYQRVYSLFILLGDAWILHGKWGSSFNIGVWCILSAAFCKLRPESRSYNNGMSSRSL